MYAYMGFKSIKNYKDFFTPVVRCSRCKMYLPRHKKFGDKCACGGKFNKV